MITSLLPHHILPAKRGIYETNACLKVQQYCQTIDELQKFHFFKICMLENYIKNKCKFKVRSVQGKKRRFYARRKHGCQIIASIISYHYNYYNIIFKTNSTIVFCLIFIFNLLLQQKLNAESFQRLFQLSEYKGIPKFPGEVRGGAILFRLLLNLKLKTTVS